MKVRLSFKTSDVADYALEGLDDDERAEAEAAIEKFVEYGECLTVEIDTEAGTCVGVKV